MITIRDDTIRNGIYGAIVGDALGVPYEFTPRPKMDKNPCTTMTGHGTYNQPVGTWSDDTSTILATMDAIANDKTINYETVMDNFARWVTYGEYTPHGKAFDVGNTTSDAIINYILGVPPLHCGGAEETSNGNGSIMRMMPVALYLVCSEEMNQLSLDRKMDIIHNMSSITHRHKRSQMACGTYCLIAMSIMEDNTRPLDDIVTEALQNAREYYTSEKWITELPFFEWVFSPMLKGLHRDEINSGGYTIDTLEASIWCLLNHNGYVETVLSAVNLGDDTDTTACAVGGLASLYYGYDDIPKEWVDALQSKDFIDDILKRFCDAL